MATLLSDSFTGANGTNLTAHAMNVGGGWSAAQGVIQIQSNKTDGSAGTSGTSSFYYADAGVTDGVMTCDITIPSNNFASILTLRGTAYSDVWLFDVEDDSVGTQNFCGIYERTANVQTQRAFSNITSLAGTTTAMTVTATGNVLTLVMGTANINYTSSVRNTDTHWGIVSFFTTGVYPSVPQDNFLVTGGAATPTVTATKFLTLLGVG